MRPRRFLRILPPMFVFMAVYALAPALTGEQTWSEALRTLCTIPLNFPENAFHLWFMYPLIGLYLLIPILSPWLRTATRFDLAMFPIDGRIGNGYTLGGRQFLARFPIRLFAPMHFVVSGFESAWRMEEYCAEKGVAFWRISHDGETINIR